MLFSEIRELLVSEHLGLRALAAETKAAAQEILDGRVTDLERLRSSLTDLDGALDRHNRHEDELLRGIVRTIDAWGPQRESLMNDDHLAEHASIQQSLAACRALEDRRIAAREAIELVARMVRHMDSEEREVLHPDILRDDVVTIQGFSG